MSMLHRFFGRLRTGLTLAVAGLGLSACVSTSSLDDLAGATPTGSAFTRELFNNYSYLANSFSTASGSDSSSDDEGMFSMFDDVGADTADTSDLAEAFATKALIAARGVEPAPEPSIDGASAAARDRLLRALAAGKDRFPVDAARAQTDFDCWMLNSSVSSQRAAADRCRTSFGNSIARLESDMHPPVVTPAPAAAALSANYTVYFDFDSWTLTGEQLTVLQEAVATARAGGQSQITVVGHTDTSGTADYNQKLSLKRANVVAETLVDMGARREAIQISGVGETDLAVPTADGVKEPKNRRAVVTLVP